MAGSLYEFNLNGKSLVTERFIETGTYAGETTAAALRAGFKIIDSIEICERHYKNAVIMFESCNNVNIHYGSSHIVLPKIINPNIDTVFYLDGHYQGTSKDEIDESFGECPIIEELNAIMNVLWKKLPVIIIDDAKTFHNVINRNEFLKQMNLNPNQWPTIFEIKNIIDKYFEIQEINDRFYCTPIDFNTNS